MRINQNISAMNTYSRLTSANTGKSNSLAKLSSGLRINKAGDDAAGLAISEKMRGQVGGLKQATRNAQDGISLIQTAEGALNETHSILNRMRELAVQASNGTNTGSDRAEIQKEIDQLATEITRISTDTEFNTQKLLNNSLDTKFHIGANSGQNMELKIGDLGSKALGVTGKVYTGDLDATNYEGIKISNRTGEAPKIEIKLAEEVTGETKTAFKDDVVTITLAAKSDGSGGLQTAATQDDVLKALESVSARAGFEVSTVEGDYDGTSDAGAHTIAITLAEDADADPVGINVSSREAADAAISAIDAAVQNVSSERSKLGSVQNRLEHTINNLTATAENLSAAESRIRDVDMAEEMMEFTKNNILSQAATAMLAQANQMPNSVLQLLQ